MGAGDHIASPDVPWWSDPTPTLPWKGRGLVLLALLLSACGKQAGLHPLEGHALPPKPALAPAQPTVAQLLTPDPQTRPERSDELLKQSQQRRDDRFDLPPPG